MKKTIKKIFIATFLLLTSTTWAQRQVPCKQVIGYYCDWLSNTVDYSKYTILNYAFVQPQPSGTIDAPVVGTSMLTNLVSSAHQNGVKVLVSVGGWTWSNNFPTIAASATTRNKFASECARYITTYNLDGIDIDWEYPGYADHAGTSADKANFTLLMQAIRTAIGSKMLTACFGIAPDRMANIQWSSVVPLIDMFNLMTYDCFGSWDQVTNHNSPLYAPAQGASSLNVDYAFKAVVNTYGVPSTKVNIGGAFYGHAFAGATSLFGTFSGPDGDGSPTYAAIMANKSGYTEYWDDKAKVPYMINTSAQKFISYDNEQSMKLKGQYARDNNACGVIVWEISGDRIGGSNPLAAALNQGLCGTVGIDEQQQLEAYVYPNPANDFVTISLVNSTTNNQVAVYNALGQMVISQRFNQSMFSISLKELEPGIYFINIANESGVASKKIVKE